MIKKILLIIALMTLGATLMAQSPSSGIPKVALASDASIIEMNHATLTLRSELISDSATLRVDTVHTVSNIEWRSPAGTGKKRMARRRLQGSDFYDFDRDRWLDIWWFTFKYPSINAKGEPVLLTAMACMPDEDCSYVNNVIIGCHVTITSNKECPSMYNHGGSSLSDVSMIMNHAGSGLVFHSSQDDYPYYNLVILPDYELERGELGATPLPQRLAHHFAGLLARRLGGAGHPPLHRAEQPVAGAAIRGVGVRRRPL